MVPEAGQVVVFDKGAQEGGVGAAGAEEGLPGTGDGGEVGLGAAEAAEEGSVDRVVEECVDGFLVWTGETIRGIRWEAKRDVGEGGYPGSAWYSSPIVKELADLSN